MEEQPSKRISSNSVAVDRISALPNCILGIILSFLPTKLAVASSVLSKRWKSSWLDVHILDLSSQDFVPPDSDDFVSPDLSEILEFIRFVHKALRLVDARRPLNKFSLVWHNWLVSSHVICWIDDVIQRNVRDIFLYLGNGDLFKLPITGFNCHSLKSLQVTNIVLFNDNHDTTAVSLPSLERLELDYARFNSEDAFEKLIRGSPMLRRLKIALYPIYNRDEFDDDDSDYSDAEEEFMYVVSAPSLRHLDMYVGDRCTLKINAPSLEYIRLHGRISEVFVEKSLASLVEAHFDTEFNKLDSPGNLIVEVVRALEHTKSLTLSASVMRGLGLATQRLSTEFKRLVKLVAKTYCCSVQDIIQNSEVLEILVIDKVDWFDQSSIDCFDHSRWTAPVVVPRCLSKSLKNVRFKGYKGLEDEREMIRYMLEHGTALEVMEIHCCSDLEPGKRLELVQEICEFPRKSLACQLSTWPTMK